MEEKTDLVVVLGPTAGGKTRFAALLADRYNGEVISADSRQVYRQMDLGTGKDLDDYIVHNRKVPYHLINLVDPGHHYSLFEFQHDFISAFKDIHRRGKLPILCGGTGLYIESVVRGYQLIQVQPDPHFRASKESTTTEALIEELKAFGPLHNKTDTTNKKRLIRALEIAHHTRQTSHPSVQVPPVRCLILGIRYDRQEERKRITERLKKRLESGLAEEVQRLLSQVGIEGLSYYGLEYKFISQYCIGQLTYDEMFTKLNTAIHQFAKRQMTWFRRMERNNIQIHWIEGEWEEEKRWRMASGLLDEHLGHL